jgi:hypothetical protein
MSWGVTPRHRGATFSPNPGPPQVVLLQGHKSYDLFCLLNGTMELCFGLCMMIIVILNILLAFDSKLLKFLKKD